ncbi:hypothetical protein B9479_007593 [Cryptococcus floricola]|uniref:Magnesium and cobalt transporter CorA n=1 Tax=Cryptococcus floricola TaxID=2591691 RepID=A0A5D3AJS6_9TREE|nr:hypothetical protein B9479_007593 [Cryptococcus floricola]
MLTCYLGGFGIRSLGDHSIDPPASHIGHFTSNNDAEAQPVPSRSSGRSISPTATLGGIRNRRVSGAPGQAHGGDEYRWLNTVVADGTGDEPGVDVKSKRDEKTYGHLKAKTKIEVVDYSSDPNEEGMNLASKFPGEKLQEWLDSTHGKRRIGEDGKPTGVRWIQSISMVSTGKSSRPSSSTSGKLHPLAVEDALEAESSPRSKLDFYRNHLYLQLLIHRTRSSDHAALALAADEIAEGTRQGEGEEAGENGTVNGHGHGGQNVKAGLFGGKGAGRRVGLPDDIQGVFEPSMIAPRRSIGSHRAEASEKEAHKLTVDELSAEYMVPIRRNILSIFMLRTLISLDAKPAREVLAPIYARLRDEQSLLRRSADVSMLAQAILDTVADLSIQVSQTFESEILKMEASVLVDPQMETVRHLHVLSSQLIRLRRALTPLLHVCYVVRDQDLQRSVAASSVGRGKEGGQGVPGGGGGGNGNGGGGPQGAQGGQGGSHLNPLNQRHSGINTPQPQVDDSASVLSILSPRSHGNLTALGAGAGTNPINPQTAQLGFFTPLTKVYIEDVIDHLEIVVGSLEQFVSTCDHLTDYVFNVLSFQTNASMERLSIVTVVFLPLTFIASYFGMNFTSFAQIEGPVSYFWKVAIPCTVGFFLVFSFSYLKALGVTLARRVRRWEKNVLSFQTNASMERLSIVTVVFLPLTCIASYFGMNFTSFAQIEGPVSYFWKVAIPLLPSPQYDSFTPTSSSINLTALGAAAAANPQTAQLGFLGFFTPLTKFYIEDVIDHLEIVVGSLEQFVSTCDHLTDYVFNVLSFQTNASMERLSIVTVVFLPLTFIASYFGMNFTNFAQIEGPVSYFWKVAIPCTVGFFLVFSFSYLRALGVTLARRVRRWEKVREVGSGGGRKGR